MFNRDQLQARQFLGYYPEIPAIWPNRATRRAVKQNRLSRLSGEWRQKLAETPGLRAAVVAL
jgi:hypothetical protein